MITITHSLTGSLTLSTETHLSMIIIIAIMTLIKPCTDDRHETSTTVHHSSFGDDFLRR